MKTIKPKCKCGRGFAILASDTATEVVDRTCRKCGARWRIIVKPLGYGEYGFMHKVELTCTKEAK